MVFFYLTKNALQAPKTYLNAYKAVYVGYLHLACLKVLLSAFTAETYSPQKFTSRLMFPASVHPGEQYDRVTPSISAVKYLPFDLFSAGIAVL